MIYIYYYIQYTYGCLEVALPNARGSRKKKRVNIGVRECVYGVEENTKECIYISTKRGENSYCYIDRPYGL